MNIENLKKLILKLESETFDKCDSLLSGGGLKRSITGMAAETYVVNNDDFCWIDNGNYDILLNRVTRETFVADLPNEILDWYGATKLFEYKLNEFESFQLAANYLKRIVRLRVFTL